MNSDRIELGDLTQHNIKQLKLLNQVILPVTYNDKFYKDVLDVGDLAKLAFFNDIVVGAVCCRIDNTKGEKRLYIMTLGCLAPYRQRGVGTMLLQHVFKICEKDKAITAIFLRLWSLINCERYFILLTKDIVMFVSMATITCTVGKTGVLPILANSSYDAQLAWQISPDHHVQVNNQSALEFYKKFGFSVIATEKQYYKRIEPSDAYVLEKDLTQSSGDKISVNEFCRGVF